MTDKAKQTSQLILLILLAASLTLTLSSPASAADTSFKTSSVTIKQGSVGNIILTLTEAPQGLEKFQISLKQSKSSVANFSSIEEGVIPLQIMSEEGDQIEIRGADLGEVAEPGAKNVKLATIEVTGLATGQSSTILEVEGGNTLNDNGNVLSYNLKPGTISVGENNPPEADFQVTPSPPQVGQQVTLDASASSDPDGSIAEYLWDLNEDGSYEQSGQTIYKTWSSSGSWLVKLKVVDSEGAEKTISKNIEVASTQEPPKAEFSYSPQNPEIGATVDFDGSGSLDPDGGSINEYQWDLNGDNRYEKSGRQVSHAYDSSGPKGVTLKVTDDEGSSDTKIKYVTVSSSSTTDGGGPTARISTTPAYNYQIKQSIEFSATGSSDPDGSITSYEWDLNGDGSYEERGGVVSKTYRQSGDKRIRLQVTNSEGETDTASKTISLRSGSDGTNGGGFPWMIILLVLVLVIVGVVVYLSLVPEEKQVEEDYELSPLE